MMLIGVLSVGDKDYWPPRPKHKSNPYLTQEECVKAQLLLLSWLKSYGVDKRYVFEIQIYRIDRLFIRVFEYDRGENGNVFMAPNGKDFATRKPYDVLVKETPPVLFRVLHEKINRSGPCY